MVIKDYFLFATFWIVAIVYFLKMVEWHFIKKSYKKDSSRISQISVFQKILEIDVDKSISTVISIAAAVFGMFTIRGADLALACFFLTIVGLIVLFEIFELKEKVRIIKFFRRVYCTKG